LWPIGIDRSKILLASLQYLEDIKWSCDNASPLLQKFLAQVQAAQPEART
jgi:hypothetical protein